MKQFSSKFLLILFLLNAVLIHAQAIDSVQYKKVYTDFNQALKEPLKVYRLNLSNMSIDSFPIDLSKFKNLEYLCLNSDQIEFIPREIEYLQKLRSLQLVGNDFKTLPPEFSELKNLEEIYFNVNKKMDFTQSVKILSTMPKLTILHLDNDGLVALPSNLSTLTHLEKLYLNDNKLTDVPKEISGLKNLKYLDMQHNSVPQIKMSNYHNFGLRVKF
jgi:Leucine-rich repeat (LRR) protein